MELEVGEATVDEEFGDAELVVDGRLLVEEGKDDDVDEEDDELVDGISRKTVSADQAPPTPQK